MREVPLLRVGHVVASVHGVGEDEAVALLFGVVGSVCAGLTWHSIWRSRQGRPWFMGDRNFGTAYISSTALVLYALASWATTVALLV